MGYSPWGRKESDNIEMTCRRVRWFSRVYILLFTLIIAVHIQF